MNHTMRAWLAAAALGLLFQMAGGCGGPHEDCGLGLKGIGQATDADGRTPCPLCRDPFDQRAAENGWMVQAYLQPQIDAGIIAQHSLFEYHFVPDSPALNELGLHDLSILAAHFREASGQLNVRRGASPEPLYQARLAAVTGWLARAGVDDQRVKLADGLAGGPGLPTERCLVILGGEKGKPVYPAGPVGPLTPSITGGMTSGGGSSGGSGSGQTSSGSNGQ